MKNLLASTLAVLLVVAGGVRASAADSSPAHPGLLEIDWNAEVSGAEPTATFQITPTLVRFFASMASEAAAELTELKGVQEIIDQLHEARVVLFEDVEGADFSVSSQLQVDRLKGLGWEQIVHARDGAERLHILILPKGNLIIGILIVAAESDELAFVNVAGDFDPAALGKQFGSVVKEFNSGKIKFKDLADFGDLVEGASK